MFPVDHRDHAVEQWINDEVRHHDPAAIVEAANALRRYDARPWIGEIDPARWVWTQYVGPLPMYEKAGFAVVERKQDFCIVRRNL